jgi:hypothetical protein
MRKPCAVKLQIPARISAGFACVNGAIHVNDELDGWRTEISDETGERHLATKGHAELAPFER